MPKSSLSHKQTFTYSVREKSVSLNGAVLNGAESGRKAFVAVFTFCDKNGLIIDGPYAGLSHSRIGSYKYIPGGTRENEASFQINVPLPANAERLDVTFSSWDCAAPIAFALPPTLNGGKPHSTPFAPPQPAPKSVSVAGKSAKPAAALELASMPVTPGRSYQIAVEATRQNDDNDKAYLLVLEFFDRENALIWHRNAGWSFNTTIGNFDYVSFAEGQAVFERKSTIVPPENAVCFKLSLRCWSSKNAPSGRLVSSDELMGLNEQIQHCGTLIENALTSFKAPQKGVVVIVSTTKSLDSGNRLNRPQALAKAFAGEGYLTFYVYYRFGHNEHLPDVTLPNIVQLPNDIYALLAPSIARFRTSAPRLALFSIPDHISVKTSGLFQRFGWKTVYEVRDDWEEFEAANVGKWYKPVWERYLCRTCDRVLCVSPALREKMVVFGAPENRAGLSPNATTVDFAALAAPYRKAREEKALGKKQRPVLGYFGHLTDAWFDWPLLLRTAEMRPDWDFEVIGFGAPEGLPHLPNLVIKDAIPQLDLPQATAHWTVGLIPFRPGALARAVDPIKVYDYLSLGIPTISVPMGSLESFDGVSLYVGIDDFISKAEALIARMRKAPLRIKFVTDDNTWTGRILQILHVMGISAPRRAAKNERRKA